MGLIPGSGRSPGEGNGNPLQYSCLGNPMDTGSQQATVHGVTRVGYDITTKPPPSPLFQWLLQLIPPVIPFVMINNKKKILLDKVKMKTLSWVRQFVTPWNFPGQNTGVGSLSLLQGIFPIQGSNPGLPHCRQITS